MRTYLRSFSLRVLRVLRLTIQRSMYTRLSFKSVRHIQCRIYVHPYCRFIKAVAGEWITSHNHAGLLMTVQCMTSWPVACGGLCQKKGCMRRLQIN